MNKFKTHAQALSRGVAFIASAQRNDGGFDSYSSTSKEVFNNSVPLRTVFGPCLIAKALGLLKSKTAGDIRVAIASWLLEQRSDESWTFNYWDKDSSCRTERPYPDDLDDTFCALSVLYDYNPSIFNGAAMADIAHSLFSTEYSAGGPYRTWLVPSTAAPRWLDVDSAVNANIAAYLWRHNVYLPNITTYLEDLLATDKLKSPYYPNSYPILYFMSEWYHGEQVGSINASIMSLMKHNFWGNPHNAALCLTTLLRNGYPYQELQLVYKYLIQSQQLDGSWPPYACWIDSHINKQPIYAGSAAITTALCVEALEQYKTVSGQSSAPLAQPKNTHYQLISDAAVQAIQSIEKAELKESINSIFIRILARDHDQQILGLPQIINQSLQTTVQSGLLQQLSGISLWGWMAYTIYDDILDEGTNRQSLPAANFCLRRLTQNISSSLPSNAEFQAESQAIMERLDAASAWEVQHCRGVVKVHRIKITRLPDYEDYWQLADRSLGHTIAALGVLYAAGYRQNSPTTQALRKFFKHYLIARQLNDDAHDWEGDLRFGHINAVAVLILQKYFEIHADTKKVIDLQKNSDLLQSIMGNGVITDICDQIDRQLKMARQALLSDGSQLSPAHLLKLLSPIELAVSKARIQRSMTLQFISAL